MRRRYDRPAPKPPTIDELPYLLTDAGPTHRQRSEQPDETERRRAEAVRALLALAREAVAKANRTEPLPPPGYSRLRAMPLELRGFLEIEGLRILLADNPIDALLRFLGEQPRKPGREAENAYRDFVIASDIAEKHEIEGTSIEKLCIEVAHETGLSLDAVHKIYYRRDKPKVALEVALRLDWQNWTPGT